MISLWTLVDSTHHWTANVQQFYSSQHFESTVHRGGIIPFDHNIQLNCSSSRILSLDTNDKWYPGDFSSFPPSLPLSVLSWPPGGHGLMTHPVRCWFPLFLGQSLSIIQTRNKCDFRSFSFFFSKERTSSITCDKYRKRGRRLPPPLSSGWGDWKEVEVIYYRLGQAFSERRVRGWGWEMKGPLLFWCLPLPSLISHGYTAHQRDSHTRGQCERVDGGERGHWLMMTLLTSSGPLGTIHYSY